MGAPGGAPGPALGQDQSGSVDDLMGEALFKRWVVLHDRYGQGMDKPWRRITNADDRRENAEVVRMITEAAEQGHAVAQDHLGTMYLYGNGVPQSDALAVEWWARAQAVG